MSFNSIGQKVVGLVVSFLGAGSGATAWLVYLHEDEVAVSVPFGQDDFDSPVYLAFTLRRDAMLTVAATASSLVHNPHYGAEGWRLGAGVSLEISVDSEPCGGLQIKKVDAPIKDGRAQLQIDASCGPKKFGPGQHFVRIEAERIGNCKLLPNVPETCNTNRIRGAYALIE